MTGWRRALPTASAPRPRYSSAVTLQATVNEAEAIMMRSMRRESSPAPEGEAVAGADHGRRGFRFHAGSEAGRVSDAGRRAGRGRTALHHPKYDFNDEILPMGSSWCATLVEQHLARKG